MNIQTAKEIKTKMDKLIAERENCFAVLRFAHSVTNESVENVVNAINPENAQEIISAYKSDDIGQVWFDFVGDCKFNIAGVASKLQTLPAIPMDVWMKIK